MIRKEHKEYLKEEKLFYYSKCDFEFNYHEYYKVTEINKH